MDHYIDTVIQEGDFLTFYYLTNKSDVSGVSYVNIGDVTGYVSSNEFDFGFDYDPNIQTFTHHALRILQIKLNPNDLEIYLKEGSFTFNEIDVFFNDGKSSTVPIGEITIHSDYPDDNFLVSQSGSSSNDGNSEYMYVAEEALSIENISVNFEDVLRDHLFIKINSSNKLTTNNPMQTAFNDDWNAHPGVDIRDIEFPYKLDQDENLYIYMQISSKFIGSIGSSIIFSGTTESKNNFTSYIPLYSQQPYLEQKDVNKIIKEKSEGGTR